RQRKAAKGGRAAVRGGPDDPPKQREHRGEKVGTNLAAMKGGSDDPPKNTTAVPGAVRVTRPQWRAG
ncbi:MAG: hypothetical protein ACR2ME_01740, partial [Acidimicrobiia bacterium]